VPPRAFFICGATGAEGTSKEQASYSYAPGRGGPACAAVMRRAMTSHPNSRTTIQKQKTMTAKKKNNNIPQNKLDTYKTLVNTNPQIELKGASVPYTSFNGHMFSYFEKDGSFGLRLPDKVRDEFLKTYKTTLFVSYGVVKKEFVLVPDKLLHNMKEFKHYFDISFEYVKSLKPK
jgi:hypothetical protein